MLTRVFAFRAYPIAINRVHVFGRNSVNKKKELYGYEAQLFHPGLDSPVPP